MQAQAGLERVPVPLPVKIERGDNRRHAEAAAVPPDMLVVDKKRGGCRRKRQRHRWKRPFGSATERIPGGSSAPARDAAEIDLDFLISDGDAGLPIPEQVRACEQADAHSGGADDIVRRTE